MKTKRLVAVIVTILAVTMVLVAFTTPDPKEVPYPENYRQWTYIKTAIIEKCSPAFAHFRGFHHIYANAIALKGYRWANFGNYGLCRPGFKNFSPTPLFMTS